ncbi:MAG: P-type DNA transfer ATPase VirB11 [Polynucleobacter sp.]|nr:P-type DNA transfer ATPase VirB11 [Polynucleobacter sp.]
MTEVSALTDGIAGPTSGFPFLDAYLAPLLPVLQRRDVTDIYINAPGEIWVESLGGEAQRFDLAELTNECLWRLARQIASFVNQGISREHPLLSAKLPDGSRVQIVAPPATKGPMAIAIRRHVMSDLSLSDYTQGGAFGELHLGSRRNEPDLPDPNVDPAKYLAAAVRAKLNILVSGGTSTGKTTFLNALLKEIPADERIILIEDTPELVVHHQNSVGLIAAKGQLGEARVDAEDLLQASLRMRPDRIIVGELRGSEAYTFLRAVNTGHAGSMTTIHANSAYGAIEQLALIVQVGSNLRRRDIIEYVHDVVDVFVHLDRQSGQRRISQILRSSDVRRL